MQDRLRLFRWIDEFMEGNFDADDVETQIKAGWYDWFCKDSSLANKTKKMGNIIKQVKKGGKVRILKNNKIGTVTKTVKLHDGIQVWIRDDENHIYVYDGQMFYEKLED